MALDVSALRPCPLLGDYKLCLSLAFAQNLLLPPKDQMKRLSEVEAYVASRETKARFLSAKIFHDITSDCFATKYFDQCSDLQVLLATIKTQAEQEKSAKVEKLARLKGGYEHLMKLHREDDCQCIEVVVDYANDIREDRHSFSCQKCKYATHAEALRIAIQEWPLSTPTAHQKMVVFEL